MNRLLKASASLLCSPVVVALLLWEWAARRLGLRPTLADRLVFSFSQVMWDEVWQRPQEFATRFAARLPVVYLAPVQIHRWLFTLRHHWTPLRTITPAGGGQLIVISPLVFSGHYKSRFVYRLNCWIMALHARLWLSGAKEVFAVVNTPYAVPVLRHLFGGNRRARRVLKRLTYDVIDDFTAFEWSPRWGRDLDTDLMKLSDAVITGTCELMELRRAARPDTEFIPCGVDFDLFNGQTTEPPVDIRSLPRPIIGYFGSISERIDLDLVRCLAERFPEASVVLIGPVHLKESDRPNAANIHYLGLKGHQELAAYARTFSVGLIPFRITPATLKLNPVKTLEYLAAGVPVVSTPIPDVERFFTPVVMVGRTLEEFCDMVERAIQSPDAASISAGREMARKASWSEMVSRMGVKILGA